ncbi:exonuclease domain-containing protein [Chryseobacterium indoltheticum]|uniref:exonuclease domain-containing protein n=1 Tax=Chryseobacterium indoltheticum TaxID=254 RepID=UPI003F494C09
MKPRTHEKNSACELGICIVQDSKIVETKTWLIKPPSFPYFHQRNIDVHGILPSDVKDAPRFDEIWYEVQDMMYGTLMIAHNASFDAGVLRGCLLIITECLPQKLNYLLQYSVGPKNLGTICQNMV